jgi:hypothetical protein
MALNQYNPHQDILGIQTGINIIARDFFVAVCA